MNKSIVILALISGTWATTQNSIYWIGARWVENEVEMSSPSNSSVPTVYNPTTGKTWMDRNLGASRVALSSSDFGAFGDLYQWGRGSDGHQVRTSATTTTLATSLTPGHGMFIIANTSVSDWRSNPNSKQDALAWSGVSSVNNPCPCGFRLPTIAEWEAEIATWAPGNNHVVRAHNSLLKLPAAGGRIGRTGLILHITEMGDYWTSNTNGSVASSL